MFYVINKNELLPKLNLYALVIDTDVSSNK